MPIARTQELATGKQINLFLQRPGGTDYIPVGCAEDITFKSSVTGLSYSCRSGAGKFPSGNDPEWSVSVKGMVFFYNTTNQPLNVSFMDMLGYHLAKNILSIKVAGGFTGDGVITGPVFIESVEESAPNSGLTGYTVEMSGTQIYTISTAA